MIAPLIVFDNDDFVVAHKPSGVLTVPSHQGKLDPRTVLGLQLQTALGKTIFPVHRLDYEVSGLVLFAKTRCAHQLANSWFEHQQIRKTYRAYTEAQTFAHIPGHIDNPRQPISLQPGQQFEWHGCILRGKRRAYSSPQGKPSLTHAQYLDHDPQHDVLCWDLEPRTGRPHQLRVDLSRHGFPIIGDRLYGSQRDCRPDCISLIAYCLNFTSIDPADRLGLPDSLDIPIDVKICLQAR